MAATDTVATDTAVDMVVMAAVATMARGLLMPSLRLRPRLSPAMATTAAVDTAMVATDMAVATTARGRLWLSPATATAVDTAAMVVTAAMAMVATAGATATARGLLSPAMDTTATAMVATATAGATA